jgi:hypothetical protein
MGYKGAWDKAKQREATGVRQQSRQGACSLLPVLVPEQHVAAIAAAATAGEPLPEQCMDEDEGEAVWQGCRGGRRG